MSTAVQLSLHLRSRTASFTSLRQATPTETPSWKNQISSHIKTVPERHLDHEPSALVLVPRSIKYSVFLTPKNHKMDTPYN